MAVKTTKVELNPLEVRASVSPNSFDAETRTVELVFSAGSKGLRRGWDASYYEELSMDPTAIRMDRLNNHAPVLNSHRSNDLSSQIGVVESARIENGVGYAKVRFSNREDVQPILNDIRDGIIRKVSVGYQVHKYQDVSAPNDEIRTFRAVDWEPFEVSMVAMAFDDKAQVRDQSVTKNVCEILSRQETTEGDKSMSTENKEVTPEAKAPVAAPAPETRSVEDSKKVIESERKRCSEIITACRLAKLPESFSEKLIKDGVELDAARASIINEWSAQQKTPEVVNANRTIEVGTEERDVRVAAIESALLHRFNGKNKLHEAGRPFMGMSLLRLAEEVLTSEGVKVKGLRPMELAGRAFHTTSDFPGILANVANKTLRAAYEAAPQTFGSFVKKTTANDFKQISRVQLGDAPDLAVVGEDGEFKYGTIGESKEVYSLATYGKIVAITRQTLINDDLNAFTRLPELMGRAAADLESDLVYAILTANANMSDSVALFHATHKNLGTSAVISATSLGEMRKLMRKQTGINGRLLNVQIASLIVPAALEVVAQQLLAPINAQQSSNVNPFSGAYQLLVEPRLDANSAIAWYGAASPGQIDTIELCHLNGQEGVMIESEMGFDVDGMKVKCRMDVAAKAIDYRGLFKNAGA